MEGNSDEDFSDAEEQGTDSEEESGTGSANGEDSASENGSSSNEEESGEEDNGSSGEGEDEDEMEGDSDDDWEDDSGEEDEDDEEVVEGKSDVEDSEQLEPPRKSTKKRGKGKGSSKQQKAVEGVGSSIQGDTVSEDDDKCAICCDDMIGIDIGTPESCDHRFCLECLEEWCKVKNSCPLDRGAFNIILVRRPGEDKVYRRISVEDTTAKPAEEEFVAEIEEEDNTFCQVCGQADREHRLLLCDGCDLAYHCECLTPPLADVPVEEWFCPACAEDVVVERAGPIVVSSSEEEEVEEEEEMRRLPRRLIPRTRASELVRQRIRVNRLQQRRPAELESSDEEDMSADVTYGEQDLAVPSTSGASVTPTLSTSHGTSSRGRSTTSRNTSSSRKTSRSRSSTSRKSTKRKRKKRKSPKKKSTKSSPKKSTARKTKRRKKTRRRKKRSTKKSSSAAGRPRTRFSATSEAFSAPIARTIKGRIAERLGLSKPQLGRTIPMQRRPKEKAKDVRSGDFGTDPLSILGGNELIAFHDGDENRPATTRHTPASSSGTIDLLDSILAEQSKMAMDCSDIRIKQDGSLEATKPIKMPEPPPVSQHVLFPAFVMEESDTAHNNNTSDGPPDQSGGSSHEELNAKVNSGNGSEGAGCGNSSDSGNSGNAAKGDKDTGNSGEEGSVAGERIAESGNTSDGCATVETGVCDTSGEECKKSEDSVQKDGSDLEKESTSPQENIEETAKKSPENPEKMNVHKRKLEEAHPSPSEPEKTSTSSYLEPEKTCASSISEPEKTCASSSSEPERIRTKRTRKSRWSDVTTELSHSDDVELLNVNSINDRTTQSTKEGDISGDAQPRNHVYKSPGSDQSQGKNSDSDHSTNSRSSERQKAPPEKRALLPEPKEDRVSRERREYRGSDRSDIDRFGGSQGGRDQGRRDYRGRGGYGDNRAYRGRDMDNRRDRDWDRYRQEFRGEWGERWRSRSPPWDHRHALRIWEEEEEKRFVRAGWTTSANNRGQQRGMYGERGEMFWGRDSYFDRRPYRGDDSNRVPHQSRGPAYGERNIESWNRDVSERDRWNRENQFRSRGRDTYTDRRHHTEYGGSAALTESHDQYEEPHNQDKNRGVSETDTQQNQNSREEEDPLVGSSHFDHEQTQFQEPLHPVPPPHGFPPAVFCHPPFSHTFSAPPPQSHPLPEPHRFQPWMETGFQQQQPQLSQPPPQQQPQHFQPLPPPPPPPPICMGVTEGGKYNQLLMSLSGNLNRLLSATNSSILQLSGSPSIMTSSGQEQGDSGGESTQASQTGVQHQGQVEAGDSIQCEPMDLDEPESSEEKEDSNDLQTQVIDEVKKAIRPYYSKRQINKEEYKLILKKCVPKVTNIGKIQPEKICKLVEAYVKKIRAARSR